MLGFNKTPRKNGHIYFSLANSVIYDRVTQKLYDDIFISLETSPTRNDNATVVITTKNISALRVKRLCGALIQLV